VGIAARVGTAFGALLISAAAFVVAAFYALITVVFGCQGSDASSPPPEGSTGDLLCPGPASILHLVVGGVAVIAPWFAVSPRPRRIDLRVAFAISSGAIFVLSLVGGLVNSWNDALFVLPPLAFFALGVALAARATRPRGQDPP
jgi:hypothetical protein